jgi:L-ascorbate metabolism protein UlaG (beta-lactamase superfamily)
MNVTYLGHSCFLLECSKGRVLFDPFIRPNSLVTERKTSLRDAMAKANLDAGQVRCDYVFLSHGHEDHTADAVEILMRTGAKAVGNWEIVTWLQAKGVSNVHPMNLGGSWSFDFGRVKMVPAVHSSSMPDGSYGGNPGGFVMEADGITIYYSGDTALFSDMKLIADAYEVDYAFLPVGDNFTMGYKEAATAAHWVGTTNIIGMHYDTFGYIVIDHKKSTEYFKEQGLTLHLMEIGETKEL